MSNNEEKSFASAHINWYPGHMAKTKREIEEDLKLIDVVIEILDARIPLSSRNPDIAKLTENKKKIIVLNKIDLGDNKQNELWRKYFENQGQVCVLVNSNQGKGIDEVISTIQKVVKEDLEGYAEKGRIGRKIRAMILRNT